MATGRIGVTPTLGVRWSKAPTGGTTSLSGLDDNSVSLVYSVGYEQVYRNGVLLSRTNDYTATTGNTITLIDATITGDIIEVFANELVPLTDAISKGQFTAKGALLSATAASTPGVLTVGSNDQVLTADSTTSTGLKWATPAAGGMTLLTTHSLSGSTSTISGISGSYKSLFGIISGVTTSGSSTNLRIDPNGSNAITNTVTLTGVNAVPTSYAYIASWYLNINGHSPANSGNCWSFTIDNYASTSNHKPVKMSGQFIEGSTSTEAAINNGGGIRTNSAITSIDFVTLSGSWTAGTVLLYGVS